MRDMIQHGLFVGLATLDLIYLVERVPTANQKVVALDDAVAAGGPATNAAMTFAYLSQRYGVGDEVGDGEPFPLRHQCTTLLTALGVHPITHLIRADLELGGVAIADLTPDRVEPPPVSSISVTQATGERAVVSLNAVKQQQSATQIPADLLQELDLQRIAVVLVDGHQMPVGQAIAQQAKAQGIPIVIDGGSWKPGFEEVLPWADYVIASANFYPPGCATEADVVAYLRDLGIPHIAITHGEQPIGYYTSSHPQTKELDVPQIQAVDTLGAGDIFHGAFCYYILRSPFASALAQATTVAALACQQFGTRRWMRTEG